MDAAHLTRGVAQHCRTTAGSGAETSPKFPIDHESLQRLSQRRRITGRREDAARRIDDLACATDAARHDRQTGMKPFDQPEPERLGRGVRLAEKIGGGQQGRHIGSLTEEAHAIFDASVTRDRFELLPVGHLRWTLRATNNPTGPSDEPRSSVSAWRRTCCPFHGSRRLTCTMTMSDSGVWTDCLVAGR